MKARLAVGLAILWWAAPPASAHRLDELLQATTIALAQDRVVAQLRLTPGVAVARTVIAELDADGDGFLSEGEQQGYAARVLRDVSLTVDGRRLPLRLVSAVFPTVGEMQGGVGEILLRLEADVPRGGPDHRLIFENRFQSRTAAYLVNGLLPKESELRITAQTRNYEQSFIQLDYTWTGVQPGLRPVAPNASFSGEGGRPDRRTWFATAFSNGISGRCTGQARWLLAGALVLTVILLPGWVKSSLRARRARPTPWRWRR